MLRFLTLLLRIFSYVFHLTLGMFLIANSIIGLSRHDTWYEVRGYAMLGAMELVCTLLGFTRGLRFLFAIAAALVLYATFSGFLSQPYMPSWLPSAATLAFLGALLVLFKSDRNPMLL